MKNKIFKKIQNQKGQAALFTVFVIMSLLLFIGLFLTNITMKQTRITENILNSVQSYYLADMGAERVLWGLRAIGGDLNVVAFPNIDDNIYSQNINNLTGGATMGGLYLATRVAPLENLNIKVSGEYKKTLRSIELSWN